MLNNLIGTLLTVGGVGYINFSVANQLGTIDYHKDAKSQAIAFSACWSIVDFAIFMICQSVLRNHFKGDWLLVWSMLVTMVLAFLLALFTSNLLNAVIYWLYNLVLKKNHKATISSGTVWNHLMAGNGEPCMVYLYNFTHVPLGFGYIDEASNDELHDYSISLQPFNYDNPAIQDNYEDVIRRIQEDEFAKKHKVREFIDFKQQVIAITIKDSNA
ncbi:MAG TPA: hypothetical protein H9792_01270 [Candidatus Limosilactobacillus excrementigallinarum]|nr:hypothetical protein [Candidatus Limosilactobacillus excrementigallinarum]